HRDAAAPGGVDRLAQAGQVLAVGKAVDDDLLDIHDEKGLLRHRLCSFRAAPLVIERLVIN
ncbi:hypothetical protein, partial [Paenibacillus sp. GbtcB18]|uniref:hypothetical protein n=1 Tax=Paenibacillus sp. GbtcB18 TaxID=2824763 RepID=UPI001C311173